MFDESVINVDELLVDVRECVKLVHAGDVVAAGRLADAVELLDKLLSSGLPVPAVWESAADTVDGDPIGQGVDDGGAFFLDFDDTTTANPPPLVLTSTSDAPTYGDQFRRPPATSHPATIPRPSTQRSTLSESHWQHRLDAPATTTQMHRKSALRSGALNHLIFWTVFDGDSRGFTDDDLEIVLNRAHQSVSGSRNGLVKRGYLVNSGRIRVNRHGNEAIVWIVSEWARERVTAGAETRIAA